MSPAERETWLRGVISRVSGRAADEVGRTEDLNTAIGLDSLGRLEVLAEIEDRFDFFMDDDAMVRSSTIGRMLEIIDNHLAKAEDGET